MVEAEKNIERLNSVEFDVNAKGMYSGKVKVYAETSEQAMKSACERAKEMEKIIKEKNGG